MEIGTPTGKSTAEARQTVNAVESPVISLRDLLDALWRRRWLFVGSVALIVVAAGLAISQLTPRYRARATVMVDLTSNASSVEGEVQMLRSQDLVARAVEEAQLQQHPAFNPVSASQPPGVLGRLLNRQGATSAGGETSPGTSVQEPGPRPDEAKIVRHLIRNLDVSTVGRSRVLRVSFTSEDPRLAALVANAIVDVYVARQDELKQAEFQQAMAWLGGRLDILSADVESSARAVEEFRIGTATVNGRDGAMISRQITQTSGRLTAARAELDTARIRLARAEDLLESGGYEAVLRIIDPAWFVHLDDSLAQLRQAQAELTARRGSADPAVVDLETRMEAQPRQTVESWIASLRIETDVAQERIRSLEASLAAMVDDETQVNQALVELRGLEGRAAASLLHFNAFMAGYTRTELTGLELAEARVVDRAKTPGSPFYPQRSALLSVAVIAACGIGALLVLATEYLRGGLRTVRDVE